MPINSNSDVVGDSVLQSDLGPSAIPVHAAIFPHDGGIIDLGTFGGPRSSAVAINSKGQVVGRANLDANNSHAFFYDGGMMTEIPLPGGNATSINDGGEVVGTYWPEGDQSPTRVLLCGRQRGGSQYSGSGSSRGGGPGERPAHRQPGPDSCIGQEIPE